MEDWFGMEGDEVEEEVVKAVKDKAAMTTARAGSCMLGLRGAFLVASAGTGTKARNWGSSAEFKLCLVIDFTGNSSSRVA